MHFIYGTFPELLTEAEYIPARDFYQVIKRQQFKLHDLVIQTGVLNFLSKNFLCLAKLPSPLFHKTGPWFDARDIFQAMRKKGLYHF